MTDLLSQAFERAIKVTEALPQTERDLLARRILRELEEVVKEQQMAQVAVDRLQAIRENPSELMDADEFWAAAEERMQTKRSRGV